MSANFQGSARERDFLQNFRMLRTGARFPSKFSRCSAREHDFLKISRMFRTGARFCSTFQDALHGNAILSDGVANPIPSLFRKPPPNAALLSLENHFERSTTGLI